jgi:hypothetical protein
MILAMHCPLSFSKMKVFYVVNLGMGRPFPYVAKGNKSDHLGAHTMHIRCISMRRK